MFLVSCLIVLCFWQDSAWIEIKLQYRLFASYVLTTPIKLCHFTFSKSIISNSSFSMALFLVCIIKYWDHVPHRSELIFSMILAFMYFNMKQLNHFFLVNTVFILHINYKIISFVQFSIRLWFVKDTYIFMYIIRAVL